MKTFVMSAQAFLVHWDILLIKAQPHGLTQTLVLT